MNDKGQGSWGNIIAQVQTPLGFYALGLLVIEAIFGVVVVSSKMSADQQFAALCIMVGLFILVVGSVTWMAIKSPDSLSSRVRQIEELLQSQALSDLIAERVRELVKPESLRN